MGSTTAAGVLSNLKNLDGILLTTSNVNTPFVTLAGASEELRGGFDEVGAMKYAMSAASSLDAASQPEITENDTFTAGSSKVYELTQQENYCQPFRGDVKISDFVLSDRAIQGVAIANGRDPIIDQVVRQVGEHLKQIKLQYEYSALNGTGQDAARDKDTAYKMQGILGAIVTNAVAAAGASLSKDLINQILREMDTNVGSVPRLQVFCRLFHKQQFSALYGNQPRDFNMGGVNMTQIMTDSGSLELINCPKMPLGSVLFFNPEYGRPVKNSVDGQGISLKNIEVLGQGVQAELYGKLGFDYGHEAMHGLISGLATS